MIRIWQEISFKTVLRTVCGLLLFLPALQSHAQTSISSGYSHSLYLCPEGEIYSWGDNLYGQLGWGKYGYVYQNYGKITSLKDIRFAAAYGFHNLAIRKDSSLWAWGLNNLGQLGNDDYCSSKSSSSCTQNIIPLRVEGGETGDKYLQSVIAVTGGLSNSYALLSSGEVVAWGDNSFGQIGNGNKTTYWVPRYVRVSSSSRLKHIKSIASTGYFACALDSSGTVWAWGNNEDLQLACGSSGNKSYAQPVKTETGEKLSRIMKIAVGMSHALFLTTDGYIYGSGLYKGNVQAFNPKSYAQIIAGGATQTNILQSISDISAGMVHSLAVQKLPDGSNRLLSWGENRFYRQESLLGGQLGLGSMSDSNRAEPDFVRLANNDIVRDVLWMSANYGNSYVMAYNDFNGQATLYGCGINNSYQLGLSKITSVFRASEIPLPDCQYNCSTAFLGKDLQVCNPFTAVLHSGSKSLLNIYRWKRNDTLLPDTTHSIITTKDGTYTLTISRRSYDCALSTDTLKIHSKQIPFTIFPRAFCSDSLHFSVLGNEQFSWWNSAYYGQQLSEKQWVNCNISESYQPSLDTAILWLQSESCQRLPVVATKNCKCKITQPMLHDTTVCKSSTEIFRLKLDSVIWYKNRNKDTILGFESLQLSTNKQESTRLYASKWSNGCESKNDSFRISVVKCLPYYHISGSISPAIQAKVYLYDTEIANNPSDSATLTTSSIFNFIAQQGEKTIQVVPYDTVNYANTWFYNSRTLKTARTLNLIANVSNLQIQLQSKTDIYELESAETESFPNPCQTDVYITLPINKHVSSVNIRSTAGTTSSCPFDQNGSILHVLLNQLASGYYYATITCDQNVIHSHFVVK